MAVKIKGLDRLQIKLTKFPEVAEKLVRAAMEQGAHDIVNMMQNLVPVDKGDLRDSIGWTWGNAPKYSQRIGSLKSNDGKLTITIYAGNSKVRYAHLVEFGSAPHVNGGMYPGTFNPGAKAQPFFYVSWRAKRRSARARVSRAITKAAKQIAADR
ncbi:HK97 gp10 family phage protein [Brucella sp. MAB-22]|uniref:HK97-gp10 family putative phage morphogenesis protein n=1 Tax=Brucella sp. MAB-22 TaxID=2986424 RepID=UPI0022206534|nr:HK97-gp10 family putative phage morphogenesis protein [Brucella sp. MAB-22]UYT54155.1 HK97 gp10 family phage protein [Brucella sp. MAB-22]